MSLISLLLAESSFGACEDQAPWELGETDRVIGVLGPHVSGAVFWFLWVLSVLFAYHFYSIPSLPPSALNTLWINCHIRACWIVSDCLLS